MNAYIQEVLEKVEKRDKANETGNKLYGFAVSAAALVVALLAPILGAITAIILVA